MSDPVILTGVSNRVATLTFNRPEKLNTLSAELLKQSIEILQSWGKDSEVGAVVLTGVGRAFCAGGDVSTMSAEGEETRSLEQNIDRLREMHELPRLLYEMPKVTIAAVNGFAMGAGLGISLACDLRVASDQARFGTAFAKVGYSGDFGTTWLLTHLAGPAKAKELFFLGDIIDAVEAHWLGLVNRVVPHESLMEHVVEIAEKIANGPLTSYRYMKANVNMASRADFRSLLERESESNLLCGMTEDHKEGVRAFMEKRAPRFIGR